MSKQVAEAEECIKKAEKYLKTSLIGLKFKPDHDSAAQEYQRAGVCYRNAKKWKECADAYAKAAECHEAADSAFHAAKCKESAAMACRDGQDLGRAVKFMEEAGQQYAESGSSETSAQALDKAGKFFEGVDDDKAIHFYRLAYQIVAETDRTRQASEFLTKLVRLYMKQEKWTDAAKWLREEIKIYVEEKDTAKVGRLTMGLVLIHLKAGDAVEAVKSLSEACGAPGYQHCQDAKTAQGLLDAWNEGDVKKFDAILSRPDMRAMDNQYLRLMKNLKIPAANIPVKDFSAQDGDDDEDEMDLC